jgi:hypothetical protein
MVAQRVRSGSRLEMGEIYLMVLNDCFGQVVRFKGKDSLVRHPFNLIFVGRNLSPVEEGDVVTYGLRSEGFEQYAHTFSYKNSLGQDAEVGRTIIPIPDDSGKQFHIEFYSPFEDNNPTRGVSKEKRMELVDFLEEVNL